MKKKEGYRSILVDDMERFVCTDQIEVGLVIELSYRLEWSAFSSEKWAQDICF